MRLLGILSVLLLLGCEEGEGKAPAGKPSPPAFAILHTTSAPNDAAALAAVLETKGAAVQRFTSKDAWLKSNADVLVLRTGNDVFAFPETEDKEWDALKTRRVIGIGREAGDAFDTLGLEIGSNACASFGGETSRIRVFPGTLVSKQLAGHAVTHAGGTKRIDSQAIHIPSPRSHLLKFVEVVARWTRDRAYAPVARQGNHVFCGIGAPAGEWTDAFKTLMREVGNRLRAQPLKPFKLAEWETTAPGEQSFLLERGQGSSFFFKFAKPTYLSAKLEVKGAKEVMFFFMAQRSGLESERLDTEGRESLHMLFGVTEGSILANGDRYWEMRVVNFDYGYRAQCKLTIRQMAHVDLPGDLRIPIDKPPSDKKTIQRLIEALKHKDSEVRLTALAALSAIGKPALPLMRAARKGLDSDTGVQLSMLADEIEQRPK